MSVVDMRHLIFNSRDALCMIKITSERKRYYQVLEHTSAFPTGRFHAQKRSLILYLGGFSNWLYHFLLNVSLHLDSHFYMSNNFHAKIRRVQVYKITHLNHIFPNKLPWTSHSNRHVTQQRRVAYIRGIRISLNITRPFESCCISMARSNITLLELFELLLRAKFVCLYPRTCQ